MGIVFDFFQKIVPLTRVYDKIIAKREENMFKKVYPREKYLKKIRPYINSDIVKVITGMRRVGKSYILKAIANEMLDNGTNNNNIIYLPLNKRGFRNIKTTDQLENIIENYLKKANSKSQVYILIDEVQNVAGFESVVLEYQEEGYSVFITGSNSYLLSDEITTKLTGRHIDFEIFSLDFNEYLEMKKFHKRLVSNDLLTEFKEYIVNGGLPKTLEFKDLADRQKYTISVIDDIFKKDVRKRKKINNVPVYERVQNYLVNNYGAKFSLTNLLSEFSKNKIPTKATTLRKYIGELNKAKILYECNRFDLKSRKSLRREQKYYLSDLGIYFSTNTNNKINYGVTIENLIYLYLLSNDFHVSLGIIGDFECDFIIRKNDNSFAYIQSCYTLQGENENATNRIIEREYRPFRMIDDSYPRYIITLDRLSDNREGVKHINLIDLLLNKEKI